MKGAKNQPWDTIDLPETFADWHMPWPDFAVDWRSTALVVVDMQNYGCNPEVGVAQMLRQKYPAIADYYVDRLVRTVIPNARRLLAAFRRHAAPVLFTRHGPLLPDGRDMIERRRRRDASSVRTTNTPVLWHRGTFEHEVIAELAPVAGELVVDKNTSSAFNSTGIEWLLRNMGIQTIVVIGIATDMSKPRRATPRIAGSTASSPKMQRRHSSRGTIARRFRASPGFSARSGAPRRSWRRSPHRLRRRLPR